MFNLLKYTNKLNLHVFNPTQVCTIYDLLILAPILVNNKYYIVLSDWIHVSLTYLYISL